MLRPSRRVAANSRRVPATRAGVALVLLLGAEAAGLTVLVRLGRSAPFDLPLDADAWARADPVDALAAALRWVALAVAAWLLLATLVSVAASTVSTRRTGRRSHVEVLARVAPRAIRHLVERAIVGGLLMGVTAVPTTAYAAADSGPPVVTIVRDGRAGELTSLPGTVAPATVPPDVVATTLLPMPTAEARSVVVAPGEHLWELAAREVARVKGIERAAVADAEIAPYWVAVCDANRDRLSSGDVNLVFVGETVVLPPHP